MKLGQVENVHTGKRVIWCNWGSLSAKRGKRCREPRSVRIMENSWALVDSCRYWGKLWLSIFPHGQKEHASRLSPFKSSFSTGRVVTPIQGFKAVSNNRVLYKNINAQFQSKMSQILTWYQKKNNLDSQVEEPNSYLVKVQFLRGGFATFKCS